MRWVNALWPTMAEPGPRNVLFQKRGFTVRPVGFLARVSRWRLGLDGVGEGGNAVRQGRIEVMPCPTPFMAAPF